MASRRRFAVRILVSTFLLLIWTFNGIGTVAVVKLEYRQPSRYNETKVALLIEDRPQSVLAPLLLHMISVVPDDWKIQFMGSDDSIGLINRSSAILGQVKTGKLDITYIPKNLSTDGQEAISQVLTNLWFYETVLHPAEWLLIFQTDSILCANSDKDLNDWLDYDWVGAPWVPNSGFGGNGGLSLRRVSSIVTILRNQQREPDSEPEDVWLSSRLGHRPGAVLANGTLSGIFSTEMLRQTQEPMGYHIGGSGGFLHSGVWGTLDLRQEVYNYCPEIKMELDMDTVEAIHAGCGKTDSPRAVQEAAFREQARIEAAKNQVQAATKVAEMTHGAPVATGERAVKALKEHLGEHQDEDRDAETVDDERAEESVDKQNAAEAEVFYALTA